MGMLVLGFFGVVLLFAFLFLLWGVVAYNGLIAMRNAVKNAFSQIDVQLKRRHDLIPNLVETAKAYMAHERGTLEAVIAARNQAVAVTGKGAAQQAAAENALTGTLRQLFAVAENYPQLRANENMLALQEELTATENKIAFARQYYNDSVMRFNTKRETVPTNIIAGMFSFAPVESFAAPEEERQTVKVSFS